MDPTLQQRVWNNHEHYRVGYDAARLKELFPNPILLHGCYWNQAGAKLRAKLDALHDEEIVKLCATLINQAKNDIKSQSPKISNECAGIWCLSRRG